MQWNNGHGCWIYVLHVSQTCAGRGVSKLAAGLVHSRPWPNLSVLIQALGSHMESRHRQRQLNLQYPTAQRASLRNKKSMTALVLGPNRSTDPVQDSPPRQSRRPGVQALACLSHLSRRVGINPRPRPKPKSCKDKQASNGRRVPLQLSWPGQPCTSPTASWDAATRTPERPDRPVSETSIYRKNRDQRVLRVSFVFLFS